MSSTWIESTIFAYDENSSSKNLEITVSLKKKKKDLEKTGET